MTIDEPPSARRRIFFYAPWPVVDIDYIRRQLSYADARYRGHRAKHCPVLVDDCPAVVLTGIGSYTQVWEVLSDITTGLSQDPIYILCE